MVVRSIFEIGQRNNLKLFQHTAGNPPSQLWKKSLFSLLVTGYGCVPKVCWNQPLKQVLPQNDFGWKVMDPKIDLWND